jgi:hypothetical protein
MAVETMVPDGACAFILSSLPTNVDASPQNYVAEET